MLVLIVDIAQTAASGAWSFNTEKIPGAMLHHVYVKSTSAGTTYTFTLTDDDDNIIYSSAQGAGGVIRAEVEIPVRGVLTVAVASSSADEAFTGRLAFKEEVH